jgi:hypothetical protein
MSWQGLTFASTTAVVPYCHVACTTGPRNIWRGNCNYLFSAGTGVTWTIHVATLVTPTLRCCLGQYKHTHSIRPGKPPTHTAAPAAACCACALTGICSTAPNKMGVLATAVHAWHVQHQGHMADIQLLTKCWQLNRTHVGACTIQRRHHAAQQQLQSLSTGSAHLLDRM